MNGGDYLNVADSIRNYERKKAREKSLRVHWFVAGGLSMLLVFVLFYVVAIRPMLHDIEKNLSHIVAQRDSAMAENAALRAKLNTLNQGSTISNGTYVHVPSSTLQ